MIRCLRVHVHRNYPTRMESISSWIMQEVFFGTKVYWKRIEKQLSFHYNTLPQLILEKDELPKQFDKWCCGLGVLTATLFLMNFVEQKPDEFEKVFSVKNMKVVLDPSGKHSNYICRLRGGLLQGRLCPPERYLTYVRREFFCLCDRLADYIHVDWIKKHHGWGKIFYQPSPFYLYPKNKGMQFKPVTYQEIKDEKNNKLKIPPNDNVKEEILKATGFTNIKKENQEERARRHTIEEGKLLADTEKETAAQKLISLGENETKSVESERTASKDIHLTATAATAPRHPEVRRGLLTPKQGPPVSSDKKDRVSEKGHPESEINEESVDNKRGAKITRNDHPKSEIHQDTIDNTKSDRSDTSEY